VGGVGEDEMLSPRVGALDGLGHGGGRLERLGGLVVGLGSAGRLAQRRAQMRDRLRVLRGRLAQLLDLAQELLAMGADRVELVQQRLVRRQPLVGRLAARADGRLGLLASLGQVRLSRGGPRLGALELLGEALGAGAQLGALGVGGLATALGRLDLAAQILDAGQLALGLLLARRHRPCARRRPRARGPGAATTGSRVLQELLPRAVDVDT
jgi:hypothetical protein